MPAEQINAASLTQFQLFLNERKLTMKSLYQQRLAQDLSKQQWDGCFQRNVSAVLGETYQEALIHLRTLPFTDGAFGMERGMCGLTRQLLGLFEGFVDEFLLFAVDKHRTSCALSNFPEEHKPSREYIHEVKRAVAEHWRDFALAANDFFMECR